MISMQKLPRSCPRCSAQLLGLWEGGFSQGTALKRAVPLRSSASTYRLRGTRRPLTTDTTTNQGAKTGDVLTADEDAEKIVRQAKQTFRDTLPKGYLSPEEYKLYERKYGAPLRETLPEDVGIPFQQKDAQEGVDETYKHALLRESEDGTLEEVDYELAPEDAGPAEGQSTVPDDVLTEALELQPTEERLGYINAIAKSQRELDALLKLQKDFEASSLLAKEEEASEEKLQEEEEPEEEEEEEIDPDEERDPDVVFEGEERLHRHTLDGKFRTTPSTVHPPKIDFVQPISELLKRTRRTHIKEAAEKAFGGLGLPHSPATPEFAKNLPQKGVALQPTDYTLSGIDADAYISTVLPGVYASVISTLVEVRKRLGSDWIRGLLAKSDGQGPRVLDAGAGGAGLVAWQTVLKAEWDAMREEGKASGQDPGGKRTVVVASDELRQRISRFLHNTTFLPRLPEYVHSVESADRQLDAPQIPQPRKTYDLIIATHMLLPMEKAYKRKALLDNLWSLLSPDGGVLIVLEKGHPRGFEAVADVRMRLLDEFIIPPTPQGAPVVEVIEPESTARPKEPGMIVAPCTNHAKCPMYQIPGLSPGRKDFCHFNQRFIRPPFLQRIHEGRDRNHEDIRFSYVVARRGRHPDPVVSPAVFPTESSSVDGSSSHSTTAAATEPTHTTPYLQGAAAADRAFAGYEDMSSPGAARPHPLSLPRNVLPPLKNKGHVTMDLCTPAGTLERWTVPRSFSRVAYRDARKARWGDLWALGAKTRVPRTVRLGRALARARAEGVADPLAGLEAGIETEIMDGKGKKGKGKVPGDGGVRARKAAEMLSGRDRQRKLELNVGERGITGVSERYPGGRAPAGRRGREGGLGVDELMDEEDEEDDDDEDAKELDELLKELNR